VNRDIRIPLYTGLVSFPSAPVSTNDSKVSSGSFPSKNNNSSSSSSSSSSSNSSSSSSNNDAKVLPKSDVTIKDEVALEKSNNFSPTSASGAPNNSLSVDSANDQKSHEFKTSGEGIMKTQSTDTDTVINPDASTAVDGTVTFVLPKVTIPGEQYYPQLNFDHAVPFLVEPLYSTSLVDPISTAILGMSSNVNNMAFGTLALMDNAMVNPLAGDLSPNGAGGGATGGGGGTVKRANTKRKNSANIDDGAQGAATAPDAKTTQKTTQKRAKVSKQTAGGGGGGAVAATIGVSADDLDVSFDAETLFLNTDE
jgi:hypothetical protein